MKTIVITGCSKKKIDTSTAIPACELYQGQLFKMVKKFTIKNKFDLGIISAKYGFIYANEEVYNYDMKIRTKKDVEKVKNLSEEKISGVFQDYDRVIAIMGKIYLQTLGDFMENKKLYYAVDNQGIGGFLQLVKKLNLLDNRKVETFFSQISKHRFSKETITS